MKQFFSIFFGVLGPLYKIQRYQKSQLGHIQQGKIFNNQFYVKNIYFWLLGVCVGGGGAGGFNDQTGPILLSSYPLTHIYDHASVL